MILKSAGSTPQNACRCYNGKWIILSKPHNTGMHNKTPANKTQTNGDGFTLDEEFKNLLPPLNAEDFDQLEQNIVKDGCRDDLIVWKEKKILIDGHHRHAICKKHRLPFGVEEISFANRDEAITWMLEHQKSRRNMNKFQWAEIVLKRKSSVEAEAKEMQRAGGGAGYQKSEKPVHTMKILAKLAGVSHDTLYRVSVILTTAANNPNNLQLQRQIEQLRKGDPDISINGLFKELRQPKNKRVTKSPLTIEDDTFDLMCEQWGNQEVLEREGIIPKTTNELPQDLAERINRILSDLEKLELMYPDMLERADIYNTLDKWLTEKKRELMLSEL